MKGVEYPNYYPDDKKGSMVNPSSQFGNQPGSNNQFMSSANLNTNNKIDNNRP